MTLSDLRPGNSPPRLRVCGVGRMAGDDKAVLVNFSKPLSEEQLQALHWWLREWAA